MKQIAEDVCEVANNGWLYAGMQNTDIGLAPLVNFPVCPVTDGTESKMRPGLAEASGARPGRAGSHLGLSDWDSLGWAEF